MSPKDINDNAVIFLEKELLKIDNTSYDSIDKLMRGIMKKFDLTAKELHNAFVNKHHKTPDNWIKELDEGTLHHWFKGSKSTDGKPGWVQADGSPCANEPGETKTPKCFSSGRLKALKRKGKKGLALIKSAVRRKRQKDKGQQAKSDGAKPTMVSTFAKGKKDPNYVKAEPRIGESMEFNEAAKDKPGKGSGKKDACYTKVKSRYDVWPSAYASGALTKCRKVGAANWGNKTEEMEMIRYCPKCGKDETRKECRYGEKYWDMFSIPSALTSNQLKYDIAQVHPANEEKQPDHEHSMARSELSTIVSAAKRLRKKLKGEGNIEAWVQSKITKAADYIDAAADYIDSGEHNVHGSMDESNIKTFGGFMQEALDKSKMKCNSPKSDPVGDSLTGKSHVVKACEGGKEKIIRFGQRGVKGSPKKEGESEAYANRRKRFQTRHAKNIAKGKMSAAYWANKVKW
jgi:ribosomal protein L33